MTELNESHDRQELYMELYLVVFEEMVKISKIQSTGVSSRIEGIFTSEKILGDLVTYKEEPRNRNENEIVG